MPIWVGAGGVWKSAAIEVGASGAWKGLANGWVGAGGVWMPFAYIGPVWGAILTPGSGLGNVGYASGAFGSLSDDTLSDGKTIYALVDFSGNSLLQISGFSSDPGYNYIDNITANGSTFSTGLASYSYDSGFGIASWQWASSFGFVDSVPVPASIP